MIDLQQETIVPLAKASKSFPTSPSRSTLERWVRKGVRGRTLEVAWIGGQRYTSEEAITRFLEAGAALSGDLEVTAPRKTDRHRAALAGLAEVGLWGSVPATSRGGDK